MGELKKAKRDLGKRLKDINDKLGKVESARDDEKKRRELAEEELDELRKNLKDSLDENVALKSEVEKGVEENCEGLRGWLWPLLSSRVCRMVRLFWPLI